MDFHELAKELLQLRIQSIQEPASRLLSDMAMGRIFCAQLPADARDEGASQRTEQRYGCQHGTDRSFVEPHGGKKG